MPRMYQDDHKRCQVKSGKIDTTPFKIQPKQCHHHNLNKQIQQQDRSIGIHKYAPRKHPQIDEDFKSNKQIPTTLTTLANCKTMLQIYNTYMRHLVTYINSYEKHIEIQMLIIFAQTTTIKDLQTNPHNSILVLQNIHTTHSHKNISNLCRLKMRVTTLLNDRSKYLKTFHNCAPLTTKSKFSLSLWKFLHYSGIIIPHG